MTGEFDGCILSFLLRLYTLVFFDTFFCIVYVLQY